MQTPIEIVIEFGIVRALCASLVFFVPLWGPSLVFSRVGASPSPLHALRRNGFSLMDGLALVVLLAVANAAASSLRHEMGNMSLLILAAAANGLVIGLWFRCQRWMQTRQIIHMPSRIAIQLVLYPASIVGVSELLMVVAHSPWLIWNRNQEFPTPPPPLVTAVLWSILALSLIGIFVIRCVLHYLIIFGPPRAAEAKHSPSRNLS